MRRETMIRTVLGPIMLAFSAVFGTAVTPATANAQSISVDEARAIAKEAYISPEALDGKWKAPPLVQAAEVKSSSLTGAVPVTADNFPRAESDLYFGNIVKDGGLGQFIHRREPVAIDQQNVIRLNRDTLYSAAVFDLDAGPVTITLPDAGKRFMSMQVIDENQYTSEVDYGAGNHTFTKEKIGTRYVVIAVRTLVEPTDPKDVEAVHALQDAIKVDQPGGPGKFEVPNWDQASQKMVREALLILAST